MKKVSLILLALIALLSMGCGVNSKEVTKKEFGIQWPFTYDTATLTCYQDGDIKSPVVTVNGKRYGLTGFADNKYGASDINAINEVWVKRSDGSGLMVDLGPITKAALELCK